MNTLGIAVWGLGNHALNRILPTLSSIPEISLIGVCSRTEKKVSECAKKWNCRGWTDHNEMLNNPNIDIVYLATPIGVHFKLAMQVLKADKHVWCEKPLTCKYENTKTLVQFARESNKMLAEAFMYLHHPQFKDLANFINNREYGKLHSVVCRFGIPVLDEPGFRNDPNLCGGAFWDVASYTVSAVLALFPQKPVKILFAEVHNKKGSPVDTAGRVLLRFSREITAYLEWGTGISYRNEIDLWSENGSFYADKIFSKPDHYQPVYKIRDKNGNEFLDYGLESEQFIEMLYDFCNILRSSELVDEEYKRIIKRAKVMDEIVKHSSEHL